MRWGTGWVVFLGGALTLTGCPSDPPGDDGGATEVCATDADCDDGRFCDGVERCRPEDGAAGADGCVAGAPPCADGSCDEDTDACAPGCEDADGDGVAADSCGGADCDDGDPGRYPGNVEVCDAMGVDEDCDERTFGVRDADGDGAPDRLCCNGANCGDDCDDARAGVSPLVAESCDGLDNDCDGLVDEGVLVVFTVDADGDGFGSDASDADTLTACAAPSGYVASVTDCDDDDAEQNPGNPEICDSEDKDENCSGVANEDCGCTAPSSRLCSEGGLLGACATGTQACDALTGMWGDCSIAPSVEVCNGSDDDCDGTPDDGVTTPCYADPDGDGYAAADAAMTARCACLTSETERVPADVGSIDCREGPATRAAQSYPGADEECDGIDNDCSGDTATEEDFDGDGYTSEGYLGCTGGPYPREDCHDANDAVHPGADFQTAPYCARGTLLCSCGGAQRCVAPTMLGRCPICTSTAGIAPTFDYDCSGGPNAQPPLSSCSGSCCSPRCGPSSGQSTGNCGNAVPHACCSPSSMSTCGSGCFAASVGNRPLGCR